MSTKIAGSPAVRSDSEVAEVRRREEVFKKSRAGLRAPIRPASTRVLHGCGLYYDEVESQYHWWSNGDSSDYCNTTVAHTSDKVVSTNQLGFCSPISLYYWDIEVSD